MPLVDFNSPLGPKRAAHLLRRAAFGATPQQIDDYQNLTPAAAVAQLFGTAVPAAPAPITPTGAAWTTVTTSEMNGDLEEYFLQWFIGQMLNSSLSFAAREKIVLFLHTHFTTIRSKVSSAKALYYQNELYRLFAKDASDPKLNLKELTKKVSIDNAMVRLLDSDLNVKGNPNENYARELLELYTIGRGLDGYLPPVVQNDPGFEDYSNYSERDVKIAARVLSGWSFDDTFATIDADTLLPRAKVAGSTSNASAHDNDNAKPKTFSYHFGSTTITPNAALLSGGNPTEASALDELDQLVEMIYANHETAKNICRKVYRFYVYHNITDTIDNDIIDSMATFLEANNFKIQPLIEKLLISTHFYDGAAPLTDDNFGGIIKSPLDLAVGSLRLFNFQLADMATDTANFFMQTGYILNSIRQDMGMSFFEPTDVSGYEAYHQWPIYHRAWITPNHLASRYKFIENIINPNTPGTINIDVYNWVKAYNSIDSQAGDATTFAPTLATYLFPVPLASGIPGITDKRYNYFHSQLGVSDLDWSNYWGTLGKAELIIPVAALLNAMMQSPEYQLQ